MKKTVAKQTPKDKPTAEENSKSLGDKGGFRVAIETRELASGGLAWRASWYERQAAGGYIRRRRQFQARDELEKWFTDESATRKKEGEIATKAERRGDNMVKLANLTPQETAALAQAVEMIRAAGGRVEGIADAARTYTTTELTGAKITVAELLAEHLESMQRQGKRPPTIRDRRLYLSSFVDKYGNKLSPAVTVAQAGDWVFDADTPSKQASRRRALHALFAHAVRRGYVERNPVHAVDKPRELGPDKISIFSPAEAEAMLRAAEEMDPRLVPYLAIGIFAGLRPQNELRLLDWGNVNLESKLLTVTRRTSKTARVRHVPIQPNLAAWLASVPKAERIGTLFYSRRLLRKVVAASKLDSKGKPVPFKLEEGKPVFEKGVKLKAVQWSADIMRHSFCSYRQAVIKNIAQLCHEAGNTPDIASAHYLNPRASEAEVKKFWAIMPTRKGNQV